MTTKIIIVGTDHFLQCGTGDLFSDNQILIFKSFIENLCAQHQVKAIAEEMYLNALDELNATITVAAEICHLSGNIEYHCIDLSDQERRAMSIDHDSLAWFAAARFSSKHHEVTAKRLCLAISNPVRGKLGDVVY